MTLPQETLRRKRDGAVLSASEIRRLVAGIADGSLSEGQVGAFAMAVYLRGMNEAERVALTLALRDSGRVLAWHDLPGPVLDKHSTGGVGDLVSLPLAAMVAACGGYVPMISGRGLGHTGGTLDKLSAIPGYQLTPEVARLQAVVRDTGAAIVGQSGELAPADGRLYAVRDVTATVESIPLITASILGKKLAAGLSALVMDVKTGNGAFMPQLDDARALAASLVATGCGAGLPTQALITAMDQPLLPVAGNALEVRAALDYLTGAARPARLHAVTLALASRMLLAGGLAGSLADAEARLTAALDGGGAAERFARMVAALGGPRDLIEAPQRHLAAAPLIRPVYAERPGRVAAIDTRALGLAVCTLKGGRTRPDQDIDVRTGLTAIAELGQALDADTPLAWLHAASEDDWQQAAARVRAAISVGEHGGVALPPVLQQLDNKAVAEVAAAVN